LLNQGCLIFCSPSLLLLWNSLFLGLGKWPLTLCEEIFGPVLSIMGYDTEDEAIDIANDTPFGLAGFVRSRDLSRARKIANRIRAGRVYLNGASAATSSPATGVSLESSDLKNILR